MDIKRPEPKQPRPANAKAVFKGEIFTVYQWPQKMFDGSDGVWEVVKRADTVVTIPVTPEGKIVVIDQEQPGRPAFMSFPGGRVDEGEDVVSTAKRELQEETGYEAEKLVLLRAHQPLIKMDWAIYIFIAYGCVKKHAQDLDAGEKISVREITADECLALIESGTIVEPGLKTAELKNLLILR